MKLRIGPYAYTVVTDDQRVEDTEVRGSEFLWGFHEATTSTIVLRSCMSPDKRAEVLLHEVMHACYHVARVEPTDEESAIKTLAPMLLDTIRRNPQLRKVLFD